MENTEKAGARNAWAVATSQAEEEGFSDFSEGSPGRKRRDEIAESIKAKSTDMGQALAELFKSLQAYD